VTRPVDQIDDTVDQRIRAGCPKLSDGVAGSTDVDAALASVDARRPGWGRARRSARLPLLAAAVVVAIVVGVAMWPREVSVPTSDRPDGARRGSTSTVPTPTVVGLPTTAADAVPSSTATTTVTPPMVGDVSQHRIVGGTILPTPPERSIIWNKSPGSRKPDGNGCSPGGGDLPDGLWYGYLAVESARLSLDLACRYSNDAATWAIRTYESRTADGWEELYVRNESTALRVLPLDDRSEIVDIASTGDWTWQEVSAGQLLGRVDQLGPESRLAAWVRIAGRRVVWLDVAGDNYAG